MKKDAFKVNWTNRDWVWLTGVLGMIIIVVCTHWLKSSAQDIFGYISFMSTGVSIVLALVAIGIAITQNLQTNLLNSTMMATLDRMDEKMVFIKDNMNIPSSQINSPQDDNRSPRLKMTRYHGFIATDKPVDRETLVRDIGEFLSVAKPPTRIIQSSIFNSIQTVGYKR